MRARWFLLLVLLLAVRVAHGQPATPTPDVPGVLPIVPGQTITDMLTQSAFYDWWTLTLPAGATILVAMEGDATLAPLLGLLDTSGTLATRSADGTLGGSVTLTYTTTAAGRHTVVATRVGNADGTSEGAYRLVVTLEEATNVATLYREVAFRCGDVEAVSTLIIEPDAAQDDAPWLAVVWGLDGFAPVLRLTDAATSQVSACLRSGPAPAEATLALPDGTRATLDDGLRLVAQSLEQPGVTWRLTVGSEAGATGRYVLALSGRAIPRDMMAQRQGYTVAVGGRARGEPAVASMIGAERLDPHLIVERWDDGERLAACDDAGRRACDDVASLVTLRLPGLNDFAPTSGRTLDASVVLPAADVLSLRAGAFEGRTYGPYTLVVVGGLD